MPKDDSFVDPAVEREARAAGPSVAPLKRGDACLYCRKRRIKCCATKPKCSHCTKLGRDCVYDTGKPVSRVQVLENKVKELEGYLRAATAQGDSPAAAVDPTAFASTGLPAVTMANGMTTATVLDGFASTFPLAGDLNVPLPMPPADFDFSTLDPNFMDLVSSFTNTLSPSTLPPLQAEQMLPPLPSDPGPRMPAFAPVPLNGHNDPFLTETPSFPSSDPFSIPSVQPASGQTSASLPTPELFTAYVQDAAIADDLMQDANPTYDHTLNWRADDDNVDKTLVGGWFDANDLPRIARDHLLDLFFTGMKLFGEDFHVPRFYASLTKPMTKRPHPCLLYSMYLLASRISPSPPIRALEAHFANIASKQLDEAIASADRLLDATRAATLLAVYKYSLAKYHEGWMMTGTAARLAISCGLHQISSCVFKPSTLPQADPDGLKGLLRHRAWVIPPPADAVELGERITAFWSVFSVDRCGAISTQWPPAIADINIITPFPRPLHEFELGLVTEADNISISSLFDPAPTQPMSPHTATFADIMRLRALAVLDRASKLMYLKPEMGAQISRTSVTPPGHTVDDYLSSQNRAAAGGSPDAAQSSTQAHERSARVRTPLAYEEVLQALLRIEADLPPDRRTNWAIWDGKVQEWHFQRPPPKEVFTLHILIGCSWMFLFDVWTFNAVNADAVGVARRLAFTVRMVVQDMAGSPLDVFVAMCLSFIVKILIREVKRLQSVGDFVSAGPIEADIEVIVQTLRAVGKRYNIGSMQAMRVDRYRQSSLDEMAFMKDDRLNEEHHVQVAEMPGESGR